MKNALFSNLRILENNRKRCQCPGYFPSEILGGERVNSDLTCYRVQFLNVLAVLSFNPVFAILL